MTTKLLLIHGAWQGACVRTQPTMPVTAPASWSNGFRDLPKRYLYCARDNAIAPKLPLLMVERAGVAHVDTLHCGHEPFITRAKSLAELLLQAAVQA